VYLEEMDRIVKEDELSLKAQYYKIHFEREVETIAQSTARKAIE
jgi:hypothetical protein